MTKKFEDIIGLFHGNGPGSASLDQHCAAMRMDSLTAWTGNRLLYAIGDARKSAA